MVGVTAKAAIAELGGGEAASAFPKVQSYLQRFEKIEVCTLAAGDVGAFTKASNHRTISFVEKGLRDTL